MTIQDVDFHTCARLTARRKEARELMLIYYLTFPAFLMVAIFARLAPGPASDTPLDRSRRRSVFGEASHLARSSLPMMFMG